MAGMDVDEPIKEFDYSILELLKQENSEEELDCDCLVDIIWNVYSCSPLNSFSYEERDLNSYGKEMSTIVQTELNLKSLKCKFETVPELAFTSKDNKAIKITVDSSENKKKSLFRGFLISRDSKMKPSQFVRLPVLLCNGSTKMISAVHSALDSLFDTSIMEVKFSVKELIAFSLHHCLKAKPADDTQLVMKYELPEDPSINIEYNILVDDYNDLWTEMLRKSQNDANIIHSFYSELLLHFCNTYEMSLNFLNLSTISIDNFLKIGKKGKIRCKHASLFDILLKYLTRNINNSNLL